MKVLRALFHAFLRGFVFLGPIALTVWVVVKIVEIVDRWFGAEVRGAGVVLAVVLLTGIGLLFASKYVRAAVSGFEQLLDSVPLLKLVHRPTKDLMSAIIGEKRRFDAPVVVDITPDGALQALGFVTRESLGHLAIADRVAVYLPQAFNVAGQLLLVEPKRVRRLNADPAELLTFVVSGGVTGDSASAATPG